MSNIAFFLRLSEVSYIALFLRRRDRLAWLELQELLFVFRLRSVGAYLAGYARVEHISMLSLVFSATTGHSL